MNVKKVSKNQGLKKKIRTPPDTVEIEYEQIAAE